MAKENPDEWGQNYPMFAIVSRFESFLDFGSSRIEPFEWALMDWQRNYPSLPRWRPVTTVSGMLALDPETFGLGHPDASRLDDRAAILLTHYVLRLVASGANPESIRAHVADLLDSFGGPSPITGIALAGRLHQMQEIGLVDELIPSGD